MCGEASGWKEQCTLSTFMQQNDQFISFTLLCNYHNVVIGMHHGLGENLQQKNNYLIATNFCHFRYIPAPIGEIFIPQTLCPKVTKKVWQPLLYQGKMVLFFLSNISVIQKYIPGLSKIFIQRKLSAIHMAC